MFEERMTALKQTLIEYAALVESMIAKSIKGLLQREKELLLDVIENDETKANDMELDLDELCTTFIAQYEPKAKDLRTVLMISKMNNDLERIGDMAVNICESSLYLIERPLVKPLIDTPKMAEETITMLEGSIDSFVQQDVKLAKSVCEKDNTVDELRDLIIEELITFMRSDPATIERSIHLIRIARNLERIADLSTNIGEDVIFMVEGRVIKHGKDKNPQ